MKAVRSGRVFWGGMILLGLMVVNGCTGITATQSSASFHHPGKLFNHFTLVAAHNKWRAEVGVPGLKWSDSLAKSSEAWANTLKGTCKIKHSHGQPYGENIYYAGPLTRVSSSRGTETEVQQITSEMVVDAWGEEKKWYNRSSNSCSGGECGHYTQVVWKGTSEVGCGMAYCADDAQIWVCQYEKPGNVRGQKPY